MALTARVHKPGEVIIRQINGMPRTRVVQPKEYVICCEACEYSLEIPTRFGIDRAEEIRVNHIRSVHFTDQLTGRVVINPELTNV